MTKFALCVLVCAGDAFFMVTDHHKLKIEADLICEWYLNRICVNLACTVHTARCTTAHLPSQTGTEPLHVWVKRSHVILLSPTKTYPE